MCAFEINLFSTRKEYHRFSSDDFALIGIGLANYNMSSLDKTFTTPLNPDIKEFFGGNDSNEIKVKFLGQDAVDMEIMTYDDVEKKYKILSGWDNIKTINTNKYKDCIQPTDTSLSGFLASWNQVQLGVITDIKKINGYKLIAHRIQNSLSGCLTFDATLNILGNSDRKSKIKVFILNSKDNDSSRTIALNGSPLISAIPQTADGMRYSFSNSSNGAYATPSSIDGDNPKDKVAGQLRLAWDPTTKTWESGTQQVLARLIDSIDAPDIPKMTQSELLDLTQDQVYQVSVEDNPIMGKPTKGRAVVLSIENGNPNSFGPNFRGECGDNRNKSIILAVNRSSKAYKEGTSVVCSYINGEWVITSGDGDTVEPKQKLNFGHFEYQQYIIPANLYFTTPMSSAINNKLLPDKWIKKIRSDYYFRIARFGHDADTRSSKSISALGGDEQDRLIINWIAQSIPDTENPEQYIIDEYLKFNLQNITTTYQENKTVENIDALDFINENYCKGDKVFKYQMPDLEEEWPLPKNVEAKSNRYQSLNLPLVQNLAFEDYTDKFDVPLFWGLVFPDGYKVNQTTKFLPNLTNKQIFAEDPNLKELSVAAGASLPPLDIKYWYRYFWSNTSWQPRVDNVKIDPISLVRNTGGIYKNVDLFADVINDLDQLDGYISPVQDYGVFHNIYNSRLSDGIYGLEPVNPRRLQFSPMSIDFMHMTSTLGSPKFNNINDCYLGNRVLEIKNAIISGVRDIPDGSTLGQYADFLFSNSTLSSAVPDAAFFGNTHRIPPLSYGTSFGGTYAVFTRHLPPVAVVDGNRIVPEFRTELSNFTDSRKSSPAIPVIAVKSVVRTNANSLTFDVKQYFGNPQQKTVVPGQGPNVTILPIGPGIGWNTPNEPVKINSFPQWGDQNRTDDFDSFGTLALHARVFEHWPENQTIFLGPIYTPLHFNPGIEKDGYDYFFDTEAQGYVRSAQGSVSSSVDFKEPTNKITQMFFTPNSIVTSGNLAPFSDWRSNTTRRSKLLSGGGYAYFKKVIVVDAITVKSGGSGYNNGDKFKLQDGTTFAVTVDGENKVSGITDVEKNYVTLSSTSKIKKLSDYSDITSVTSVRVSRLSGNGAGAVFNFTFKIAELLCLDEAPKEVCGITRLTSKSNEGAGVIDSTNTKTLDISSGSSSVKAYDIFYFFHNDPAVYSIGSIGFNNTNAQYIISEVTPA